MSFWIAIFLGLVQGITEFLPVSSSGHLAILQNLFSMQTAEQGHLMFDVMLHFGTLIAVFVTYWQDIVGMVKSFIGLFSKKPRRRGAEREPNLYGRLMILLIVATLPLFVVVFLNDYVEKLYYNTTFIGFALLITGTLLYISDKLITGKKTEKNATVKNALIVGLMQAVAVIPGLSRSGTTITGGLFQGFDREFAIKFSFLLSIPAVLGANLFTFVDAVKEGINWTEMPVYLAGVAMAAVSGYFAIKFVRFLSNKNSFGKFCYYCWAVGVVVIIVSFIV